MSKLKQIKQALTSAVDQLCDVTWMFVKNPSKDCVRIIRKSYKSSIIPSCASFVL